jgi:hypothetical protein
MKITLTKETVNTYAPYVRISTTKSNPNTGAVRVSNSGARWGLSGTDFAQLLKASIFMMAYSLETVDSIRQEYDLRKDVEFEVQGISPIEVIQLSESAVNREVPKGGRPKPKFANLEGDLIVYGTQPRKVGKSSPEGKSIKKNEGTLVGVSTDEPKAPKGSKKETLKGSKKANREVEKKAEVLDDTSVRFHNAGETVLPVNLEKELEDLKVDYKKLEDSYNDEVAKGKDVEKELNSLKEDLKSKEKALGQAEERIKALEEKEEKTILSALSDLKDVVVDGLKKLFSQK